MKIIKDGTQIPDDLAYFVMAYRDLTLYGECVTKHKHFKKISDFNKEEFLQLIDEAVIYFKSHIKEVNNV